jgi:hypothetical protein
MILIFQAAIVGMSDCHRTTNTHALLVRLVNCTLSDSCFCLTLAVTMAAVAELGLVALPLQVMTRTGSAADGYTYSVNTAYEPVTGLYTSTADTVTVPSSGLSYLGLKGFVRATYANYECPSRKAYCTSVATAVVIRPKAASCSPTCAVGACAG